MHASLSDGSEETFKLFCGGQSRVSVPFFFLINDERNIREKYILLNSFKIDDVLLSAGFQEVI